MILVTVDGGKVTLYSLSSQNSITSQTKKMDLYTNINQAKVMLGEMLYTNIETGNKIKSYETKVWGISSQGDIEDYRDSTVTLESGTVGNRFDDIVPCCIDHALFIKNNHGIFIDCYS